MSQHDLVGDVAVPPQVKLTPRQRGALEHIAAHGPVTSDELGAWLHEERLRRGGRGHSVDVRCDWCGQEGAQMGAALRAKRLVRQRRGAGWVLADPPQPTPRSSPVDYDPETGEGIPY